MKILHLFSDWKWTGPAEPVVILCQALQHRGHDVVLAYRRPPFEAPESVAKGVKERKIKGIDRFHLAPISKPYYLQHIKGSIVDIIAISRYIGTEGFEIINVHNSHDHIVGALAARRLHPHIPIIRTDHKRDSLENGWFSKWFYRKFTDGLITFSEKSKKKLVEELGVPQQRVVKVHPAVDLRRFDPKQRYRDMRSVFGIPQDAPIVGIVARFQKYRRTDLLLEAFSQLIKMVPEARLLLVGRSSQMNKSVIEPMKRLRLNNNVVLAGYRKRDYLDTLAAMDIFALISPGSDGTARALREAMAMGKPVVVTRRGMLPELVENGVNGFVLDESPDAFCQTFLALIRDDRLRKTMGSASYEIARRKFRIEDQAKEVEDFYQQVVEAWNE